MRALFWLLPLAFLGCEEPRCEADASCLVGETCNLNTGVCEVPCDDTTCDGLLTCDDDLNVCLTRCEVDSECQAGATCHLDSGECLPWDGCLDDTDCSDGLTCDTARGECADRCTVNDDCQQGYRCDYETGACLTDEGPA